MKELTLSVVTPERAILNETPVESIILPGEMGQFNVLPGHTNFLTTLRYGVFGYRVKGDWQIAFLSGGFTQIYDGKVTVLAETVDMAHELDVAKAEAELAAVSNKLKSAKTGTEEFAGFAKEVEVVRSKLRAAQKKLH